MRYEFKDGSWKSDFSHCYSILTNKFPSFTELEDHIVNRATEGGFEWISIVHNERFTVGSRVSVECSFDSYGAPLITLANSLWTDKEGNLRYGDHYEIVAYEGGCNVWFITDPDEGSDRPFKSENPLRLRFPLEPKKKHTLSLERLPLGVRVEFGGQSFDLLTPKLAPEFYIGITACEGVNRFYSAQITR